MERLIKNLKTIDAAKWATLSLLILWASTTFSIALMEISFVTALMFWLLHRYSNSSFPQTLTSKQSATPFPTRFDGSLWLPLIAFFLIVLASFFVSEYPKQSFRGIFKITKPLLAFIITADLFRDERRRGKFNLAFMLTLLLVTFDSSIQYAFGKDILRGFSAQDANTGRRLVGPFGDFGRMSAYLVIVIPVFALRFWSQFRSLGSRKNSIYALFLAATGLVLLYLTRCRGPVLALAISVLALFVVKRWFKAIGIALLLLLVAVAVMPKHMIVHLDGQKKEQSLNERFYLWRRAMDVIAAKPLTGTGINTYDRAHAKYDTLQKIRYIPAQHADTKTLQNLNGSVSFITGNTVLTSDERQATLWAGGKKYNLVKKTDGNYYVYDDLLVRGYYAHNGYLQLAAEIGIPGIFFFLLFLVMFFIRGLKYANLVRGSPEELEQLGILTGLLAFLIYACVDTNLQSPQSLMSFWFLAGVLMAQQTPRRFAHA